MKKFLLNENLLIRFVSLYIMGLALFLIAWSISYLFLPEGFLRGSSVAAKLAGDEASKSLVGEWMKIVILNLFSASLIVIANISTKIKEYPLGYVIPVLWLVHYGILLGTNSFTIPMQYRLPPSTEVLGRSGLYEIAAYTLIAVATYSLPRYKTMGFFSTKYEKVDPQTIAPLSKVQWVAMGFAILILVLSNLREALMIMYF